MKKHRHIIITGIILAAALAAAGGAWAVRRASGATTVTSLVTSSDTETQNDTGEAFAVLDVGTVRGGDDSTVQINATCKTADGRELSPFAVSYAVDRSDVAQVNADGLLTAQKGGTVNVTVSAENAGVTLQKNVAVTFAEKDGDAEVSLSSPSGRLRADIRLNERGRVTYTVTDEDGLTVLNSSTVGIHTDQCNFTDGLTFVRQWPITENDQSYVNISGKKSRVSNHYNETVLEFAKEDFFFDVYFRAYDDGFAYRFAIRTQDGTPRELTATAETGSFSVPAKSKITAECISKRGSKFCYEKPYQTASVENLSKNTNQYLCFPALVNIADGKGKSSGKFLLLSEAELFGDSYYGSLLNVRGHNVFGLDAAPKISAKSAAIQTDFTSPWRYGIYGGLGDIVESDLTENLAPAPEGDFSWVEPGVTAWMWLSEGYNGQRTESTIRDYVDLAAEMGWKYLILDEGWQPNSDKPGRAYEGYFDWFDDMIAYAADKGVGFIVWVKYIDLDTPEEREILREWADMGIKGIKADFFDSEDQATMDGFKAIYERCAECRLIVNCHGAGKPTGERRTYPNVINREAVKGEEYPHSGFLTGQAAIWAYTRNVVGPIDITPRLYPSVRGNTVAAQLACCVVFESGIPCMAGDSEDYRGFSAADFYRDLPAAWDDIHFVDGAVGNFVSIARKSGHNWYAATLTTGKKKTLSMPLSFLGEGTYEAIIYTAKGQNDIKITKQTVTADDTLNYGVDARSGYVVKFVKQSAGSSGR